MLCCSSYTLAKQLEFSPESNRMGPEEWPELSQHVNLPLFSEKNGQFHPVGYLKCSHSTNQNVQNFVRNPLVPTRRLNSYPGLIYEQLSGHKPGL